MPPDYSDPRRYPRVKVDGGFSIQFQAGKRHFFGLPVTTLGGGGCCFRVSALLAEGLQQGDLLTRLMLDHPDIPALHQQARITWVLKDHSAFDNPAAQIGIEYIDPSPEFIQAIDRCIAALIGSVPASNP